MVGSQGEDVLQGREDGYDVDQSQDQCVEELVYDGRRECYGDGEGYDFGGEGVLPEVSDESEDISVEIGEDVGDGGYLTFGNRSFWGRIRGRMARDWKRPGRFWDGSARGSGDGTIEMRPRSSSSIRLHSRSGLVVIVERASARVA